jgi:penicillin amidase
VRRRLLLLLGAAVAGGLGFAALLGAVYGLRLLQVPPASGTLEVPELASPVRIVRDRFGVPHIEAETTHAVFVGLGVAHAQDRLWQMEMLRRSARGTLSELFGPSTLQADRLARTLGLAEAAERELASLDEETRGRIEAYASGVNAWIREVREGRVPTPLEFKWLDEQPDPWQGADTLALVRLRAWMLGRSLGATLLLDRLVRDIGGVASEPFFPDRPKGPPPEKVVRLLLDLGRAADGWARASGMRGRVGSLGFVIGGEQTSSGYPLLANDRRGPGCRSSGRGRRGGWRGARSRCTPTSRISSRRRSIRPTPPGTTSRAGGCAPRAATRESACAGPTAFRSMS